LRALGFVLAAICLFAAGLAAASGVALGAPRVVLTYWCSPFPSETGSAIQVTRQWNASHPSVQVRLQAIPAGRVAEEVVREAIRNGKTPDVCSHMFPVNVPEFVKMGGLQPLDAYADLLAEARQRSGAAQVDRFRAADGHFYQLPYKCNPIMLQYNATLLRQHGLKVPRTYAEFLQVAEVLHQAGIYAWAPDAAADKWWNRYYDFYPLYLAASGGASLVDEGGRPTFDNDAAVQVLDFVRASFQHGYAPDKEIYEGVNALNEAFASGKVAMIVTGSWNIPATEELVGSTLQFGFAPLPTPRAESGEPYTYGNYRNVAMFASCQHPREAVEFMRFLMSRPADAEFIRTTSELPARLGLLEDPQFEKLVRANPYLVAFARQLSRVRPVDAAPTFNKVLQAISVAYGQAAVQGTRPARQALDEAAASLQP
jgi:multiple sugar transport system substrate-binding protein